MPLPATYRKLVATQLTTDFGAAAEISEVPLGAPAPDEVVVRTRYAGVNASDVNMTSGRYFTDRPVVPFDLGFEAAVEVVAVGEAVEGLKPGSHGLVGRLGCGYREYNVVKARHVIPVPEATPAALTIIVSGLTASIALEAVGEMKSDETLLVTAAAGGTGQYAVQLALQAGNHVIATCGSDEKAAYLRELGCHRVIPYRREDVKKVLRAEYPDGVDLVYESVGGGLFDTAVGSLARHGRLLTIGFIGEYRDGFEKVTRPRIYTRLLARSASVRGFFLPHFGTLMPEHARRLATGLADGSLRVAVDPTVFEGLESVPDAVAYLHSGRSIGKVIVTM